MQLEGRGLTCIRDDRILFKDLTITLAASEILQIQGENGCGKTSLIRVLCGLAQAYDGEVHWCGEDIRSARSEFCRELLYLGHHVGVKSELTALENLAFFQSLSNDKGRLSSAAALAHVGLAGFEDVPVRTLSAGQKRRVALARLWLSDAALWVLDEPFTAIDRAGIGALEFLLADHAANGGLVVLTTHHELSISDCNLRQLRL